MIDLVNNIGLFLNVEPNCGGVYQYCLSVIKALESLESDRFVVTCFYWDEQWSELLPTRFKRIVFRKRIAGRMLRSAISSLIRTPGGWRLAGRFADGSKEIEESDCDVVIYPAQDRLAYQTSKRSISTIHDLMHRYESHFDEYKGREYTNREIHYSATCIYSDLILVDSLIGKEHVLESYDVDESKVKILPFVPPMYLLESKTIDVKGKYSLPDRFILYPAQFWEHKNHVNLLQAIKILKEKGDDIHLVFVGSKKNNYATVMAKIDELGLSSSVSVLGYVSNDEIFSLYKSAQAMVFVSLIGPTNIPPLEALVTGCALVCSNAYGMPQQVSDAALLIDPNDPLDISNKISIIWNDSLLRSKLIDCGYQQITKYGQKEFDQILHGLIYEICGNQIICSRKNVSR